MPSPQGAEVAQDITQLAAHTQSQLRAVAAAAAAAVATCRPLHVATAAVVLTSMAQRIRAAGDGALRKKAGALLDAAGPLLPPVEDQVGLVTSDYDNAVFTVSGPLKHQGGGLMNIVRPPEIVM